MLTCYDFQMAKLLSESQVDCLLIGDSLGNVVLGFDDTTSTTVEHISLFASAVKRGAPNKFLIADLPFGSFSTLELGLENSIKIFKESRVDAVKFEGANDTELELTKRLTQVGIPVVGHIGLQPQKVKELGGYFIQGKTQDSKDELLAQAKKLEQAGAFMLVLECVTEDIAELITKELHIPTIGIGSGKKTSGQVLVINDLLNDCYNTPPSFCTPEVDVFSLKKKGIEIFLEKVNASYH
jgi:3-methyl-2-oxobutanoate hydroxymethyltransferase